jgi:hypothetical protein
MNTGSSCRPNSSSSVGSVMAGPRRGSLFGFVGWGKGLGAALGVLPRPCSGTASARPPPKRALRTRRAGAGRGRRCARLGRGSGWVGAHVTCWLPGDCACGRAVVSFAGRRLGCGGARGRFGCGRSTSARGRAC